MAIDFSVGIADPTVTKQYNIDQLCLGVYVHTPLQLFLCIGLTTLNCLAEESKI